MDIVMGGSNVQVTGPTFEQHHNGFGLQFSNPRISWRFSHNDNAVHNWIQTAYDLEIKPEPENVSHTVHIIGSSCTLVPWPREWVPLKSRDRRQIRVRCYGRFLIDEDFAGEVTDWSPWSSIEVALLEERDWSARMITSASYIPPTFSKAARPLCFWKYFSLPQGSRIKQARLYATSHDVYHTTINGKETDDYCMSPGWQSYAKRLHYQALDVSCLLKPNAENIINILVGPGWFASALSWSHRRFTYGHKLGILAQLEMQFEDQETMFVTATDDSWSCSTSSISSSEIYEGESHDFREQSADRAVYKTKLSSQAVQALISPNAPPVRVTQELKAKTMTRSKSGRPILDFGQNLASRIRLQKLLKPSSHSVIFRHAEILQNGELATRQLRGAKATDSLLSGGTMIDRWHPQFTFHGFRYVEIQGWAPEDVKTPLNLDSIVAEVMHCDMRRTGSFSCSNEELNRLHENAVWSMRGNFLSVPTDDPQRDERLGWTGDLNIFCPTANFIYDTTGMLGNWLEDLYADQMDDDMHWQKGVVPLVVPNCIKKKASDGLGWSSGWDPMPNGVWGDAAIMVPWQLYLRSGDVSVLSRQYHSMISYVEDGVKRGEDGLWDPSTWQFGDWLDPSAPPNDSGRARTDGTFVADCYLLRSTELLATIAEILNHAGEARKLNSDYCNLLSSFRRKYLTSTGLIVPDTATALALALSFDLIPASPPSLRITAGDRLIRHLRLNDFRVPTGFVGTAHLLHALSLINATKVAYAMLLSESFPSFLYPVRMGATTIWERWDALKPDGSINEAEMTSFNHSAFGSVVHWLYEGVAGIKLLPPQQDGDWSGMMFEVSPQVHHALEWARASFESRVGLLKTEWRIDKNESKVKRVHVNIVVPPNARAWLVLPGRQVDEDGVKRGRWIGSGKHSFICRYEPRGEWPVKPLLPPWGRASF